MEDQTRYVIRVSLNQRDFEDLTALHNKVSKRADVRIGRASGVVLFVVGIILLLDALVLIWLDRGIRTLSIIAIASALVALALSVFRLRFAAIQMKRNSKNCSENETVFDDEGIHVHYRIADTAFPYRLVASIYDWRGSYVLYVDQNHMIPIPKSGFTEGDPDSFCDYITNKCGLPVQTLSDQHKKERNQ